MTTPQVPIVNKGQLYVSDLNLKFLTTSTCEISSGIARDSTNTNDIIVENAIVFNTAYKGKNGIDQGVLDNLNMYAVYVIADSSGYNEPASILSLNYTTPTLPSGYDIFRRIGWVSISSTNLIVKFYQYGSEKQRKYWYNSGSNVILIDGNSLTFAPINLYPLIPSILTEVGFKVQFTEAVSNVSSLSLSPLNAAAIRGYVVFATGVAGLSLMSMTVPTQLNAQGKAAIEYKVIDVNDRLTILAESYNDYL